MKINKVLIILLFLPILGLIDSCCKCENTDNLYEITEFKFIPENEIIETDSILKFKIAIVENLKSVSQRLNIGIISNAYACSCSENFEWTSTLSEINIYCMNNFSDKYPKGSNINNLVKAISFNNRTGENEFFNMSEIVNSVLKDCEPRRNCFYLVDFEIKEKPTLINEQRFKLEFKMSDGKILKTETEIIKWK